MLIYNDGDEDVDGDFVEKCKFLHGVVNIALRYNQPSKTGPGLKVTASNFLTISHISILPHFTMFNFISFVDCAFCWLETVQAGKRKYQKLQIGLTSLCAQI